MLPEQKLFMVLLGCKPVGRLTEQHDIFFGIASSLSSLVPEIKKSWPQAEETLHVDAWRIVQFVDEYKLSIAAYEEDQEQNLSLFFVNLGGYEKGNFDEVHFKLLIVAGTKAEAVKKAKSTVFYKTKCFTGAASHIDDQYEIDDIINVSQLLSDRKLCLHFEKIQAEEQDEDELHLGYFQLNKIKD